MSQTKKLIILEGIDRSGKTTLINYLTERLNATSHTVTPISFPNRKSFTANRWEMINEIDRMESEVILCDRYYFSGVAYTAAKGVEMEWCKGPDKGLMEPDLVIFIDINANDVALRPGFGNEKYEKVEYQKKVYDLLKGLVKEHPNGRMVCGNGSVEDIGDVIYKMIEELVNKR